jgi:hypothetical protein
MKTPLALFAVSFPFAFDSACAVGGSVPEEVPAGDDAADQARIATEPAVEIAATEVTTSIEELMPYIADGALLTIQHVKQIKGDPVVIHTQEYDAKMKAIDTVVKVLARKSARTPQPRSRPTEAELAKGREMLRQGINFAPKSEDFQGTTTE